MKTLNELFANYIKLGPFCKIFTKLDPKKGLYHRMKGYNTSGTKEAVLSDDDKQQLKAGLQEFAKELDQLIKTI